MDLTMEKKIVMKQSEQGVRVYTSHYYYMELNTAKMLHDLNLDFEAADATLLHRINKIEKNTELYLDEMQKDCCNGSSQAWSDDTDRRTWYR